MTPEIRKALEFCHNLPSPPGIALKVLELARDPDVDLVSLSRLVAKDPALASRLLRASNSALFAQRRRSANLRQAMVVIGLNAALTLALSFSLSDTLQQADHKNVRFVWQRALISASAARLLAEHVGLHDPEELFLAALLQDIGVLALDAAIPERYAAILIRFQNHDTLLADERQLLDTDHGIVGSWLMRRWGLPERIAMTANAVHVTEYSQLDVTDKQFTHCIAIAGKISDLFLSLTPEHHTELTEELADCALQRMGISAQELQSQLDQLASLLPEIATLYDTQIISTQMALNVINQAREILASRNIQLIHEANENQLRLREAEITAARLREKANLDTLTGLHNRNHFDSQLNEEFALATEQGWPITLGFIDIDLFKEINDAYGHAAGDEVLVTSAKIMADSVRKQDYVTRYGGDEFLILLTGTGVNDALRVFERLAKALAQARYQSPGGIGFHCTVSIGLSSHMDQDRHFTDAKALIQAADHALYAAKAEGRNRIVIDRWS